MVSQSIVFLRTWKNTLKKIKSKFSNLKKKIHFIVLNLIKAVKIKPVKTYHNNGIKYSGLNKDKFKKFCDLYMQMHNGKGLDWPKLIIYYFFGKRFVFLASTDDKEEIIAFAMYYINFRDIADSTVHQGFTGVIPEYRGRKFATKIRTMAKAHFKKSGFKGISSRVSLSNTPSLKSNLNLGFKPVERYYDKSLNEERYYLICKF